MSKATGVPLVTMRDALADPRIFGRILEGPTWDAWRTVLIAARGEKVTKSE